MGIVEFQTLEDIPIKDIEVAKGEDGQPLNPRGKIRDTTKMQNSLNLIGQKVPISVMKHRTKEGKYELLDGETRLIAARKLGMKTLRAHIVEPLYTTDDDLLAQMLATSVRTNPLPTAKGRALLKLIQKKYHIERAAQAFGMDVDEAQLLVDLVHADPRIQKHVDAGTMALSTWKALRDKPKAVKEKVADMQKPTRKAVQDTAKAEKQIGQDQSLVSALGASGAQHIVIDALGALRTLFLVHLSTMTDMDRVRAAQILGDLHSMLEVGDRSDDATTLITDFLNRPDPVGDEFDTSDVLEPGLNYQDHGMVVLHNPQNEEIGTDETGDQSSEHVDDAAHYLLDSFPHARSVTKIDLLTGETITHKRADALEEAFGSLAEPSLDSDATVGYEDIDIPLDVLIDLKLIAEGPNGPQMGDFSAVLLALDAVGALETHAYLYENESRYMDIMDALGKYMTEQKKKKKASK